MNHIPKNALAFLARVDLKGSETAAFQEVAQWVQSFIEPEESVSPAKEEKTPKKHD